MTLFGLCPTSQESELKIIVKIKVKKKFYYFDYYTDSNLGETSRKKMWFPACKMLGTLDIIYLLRFKNCITLHNCTFTI